MTRQGLIARFAFLAVFVIAFQALVWALMGFSTVRANGGLWLAFLAVCGAMVAVGFAAVLAQRMTHLGSILLFVGLGQIAGNAGLMLTYITYSLDRHFPLWDAALARLDEAMGFHWPAMLGWFDANPAIAAVLAPCYSAFLPQQPVVLIALVLVARAREAQAIFLAGLIGLAVTHAIAFLLPAYGAYAYYDILASQHPNIDLVSVAALVPEHALVRAGALLDFDSQVRLGLITFPSYHALLAVVLAWGWWFVPYLRWPGLALNAGMLIATPLHGGHYLFDVLVGTALAIACIAIAHRIMRRVGGRGVVRTRELDWVPAG